MSPPGRGGSRGRGRGRREPVDLERYRPIIADWSAFVAAAGRPEPTVARVRPARLGAEALTERLERQGFRVRPLDGLPGFLEIAGGSGQPALTLEHWQGHFYIQQASTGLAAPALDPRPGERVLDLCAAPGGKTTHLSDLMDGQGCLVAVDVSESRIRGLLGNVYRLGTANVLSVAGDGRAFPEGALFDRVLVDAPCSGEGTLRRRGGTPPEQSASFRGFVTSSQRALLERAVRVTRPGGVVLYATCTFAPEENEAIVSDALRTLPLELEPLALDVPHAPGLTAFEDSVFDVRCEGAVRVYPHHFDSGGFFLARLRRTEETWEGADPAGTETVTDGSEGGWSAVPAHFPDGGHEPAAEPEARALIDRGLAEVVERFGPLGPMDGVSWTVRGGRVWAHTVGEWPVEGWEPGAWRAVSVGLRAIEFDSKGRARPTNDFLRWADARAEVLELDDEALRSVVARRPVQVEGERPLGPIALGWRGEVVGRGAVTRNGLASEIPKARARDLVRIMGSGSEP